MYIVHEISNTKQSETQLEREEVQDTAFEQGKRLIDSMRSTTDHGCRMKLRSEALACFQRGMKVTHEMEKTCIAALKRVGVTVIVAPYEADAQLAYLCQIGMCRAVLSDDSDLIVYSAICRTPFPILFKFEGTGMVQAMSLRTLDIYYGEGESKTPSPTVATLSAPSPPASTPAKAATTSASDNAGKVKFMSALKKNFAGESNRRLLVQMCVLAGSDYAEPIKGVDVVTAQEVKRLEF
jgi:5'-3' exonuclease